MHLSGCIFIVGITILGTVCFTIKEKDKDLCLEWISHRTIKIKKCIPNSPSQNWTVDGDFIKNPKSELCLADGMIGRGKLQICDTGSTTLDAGNVRKIRIEGNHLKNSKNQCLRFEFRYASFTDCDNKDPSLKEAVVV
jgi:hypothetical protein